MEYYVPPMKDQSKFLKIKNCYLINNSTSKTAKECNCSIANVHFALKKFGIKTPDRSSGQIKFSFNENFFEIIDTEEKAYWLGFLYADGYVSQTFRNYVSLTLSKKDELHLYKFKKSLNSNHNIKNNIIKKGKFFGKEYSIIHLTSKKFKKDLENKGCVNKKSLITIFPKQSIPDNLINHFIRGYFDGDGSVFLSNEIHHRTKKIEPIIHCRMLGTKNFIEQCIIEMNFPIITLKKYKNSNKEVMYEFVIKRKKRCKELKDFLYKNATIYLDRKKEIFDNYFKQ